MKCLARTNLKTVPDILFVAAASVSAYYLVATITFVTEQRMPDMPHVGTYLMRSSRLKYTLHPRNIAETLYHPIMGYGGLAYTRLRRKHSHAQPVFGVAPYIAFNPPFVLDKVTPHKCIIAATCCLVEKLTAQL